MRISAASSVLLLASAFGAQPSALRFGDERIGLPPLSLADSIAQATTKPQPPSAANAAPAIGTNNESASSGKLRPPATPELPSRKEARPEARVLRQSGMPIITPRKSVDYSLTIIAPKPSPDFKMVVQEPAVTGRPTPQRE